MQSGPAEIEPESVHFSSDEELLEIAGESMTLGMWRQAAGILAFITPDSGWFLEAQSFLLRIEHRTGMHQNAAARADFLLEHFEPIALPLALMVDSFAKVGRVREAEALRHMIGPVV